VWIVVTLIIVVTLRIVVTVMIVVTLVTSLLRCGYRDSRTICGLVVISCDVTPLFNSFWSAVKVDQFLCSVAGKISRSV